jgi:acyl-coenzyme A synthetase/AMP-(fatty) acid ligase
MLATLERVILCGEPCRRGWVEYLTTHCAQNVRVFNAYGPTETTVFCTTEEIVRGYPFDDRELTIALGNALPGAAVDLVPTATGERELVISSPGVGPGYLRSRPAEQDGYQTVAGGNRIYYTGDLAEISAGKMYYRGRADAQVKLRGNRFELGELEAFWEASGVPGAHASAIEDAVVLFVHERCSQTNKDLHMLLEDAMPSYAVPRLIFRLAEWPRNVNDKIDRAALACLARRELRRVGVRKRGLDVGSAPPA